MLLNCDGQIEVSMLIILMITDIFYGQHNKSGKPKQSFGVPRHLGG